MKVAIRVFLLLSLVSLIAPETPAQLVVTTAADEDNGDALPGNGSGTSLREAVKYAGSGNTITFTNTLSGQTISVTNGLISIVRSVTIDASGLVSGLIINGHGSNSLLHCGSQTTNTLSGLTLTGGRATFGGGAILNDSLLTLNNCTITGNVANEGGALFDFASTTLNNCTIVSNYARYGGGFENDGGGTLTLNNCTVAGNVATNDGGGILNFFTLNLSNCTLVGNQAFAGGGIAIDAGGTLNLHNSIVAGNTATFEPQISGAISSSTGVNLTSGNPLLSPLGNYGGPTRTMPPLPGSPAIDPVGGDTNSALITDQRGLPRVVNGVVDVGAVEVQLAYSAPILITDAEMLGDGTFQLSFSNSSGASFHVVASTNVDLPAGDWLTIGAASETPSGSGQFEFTDAEATNFAKRFYRVTSP
jgi:CSLREA domain-containing protein